jgi:glucokinase
VVRDMCDAIRRVLEQCGPNQELMGVGIGAPGPLELPSGRFHRPPNLPGFDGFLLKDAMESNLHTPVIVECDANAAALAEWKSGVGKEMPSDSMCMLTLGTGVGAGIILDRKIWHGMNGMGGEGGHIPVVENGFPCGCGGRGCLEQYASATAICRAANRAAARGGAPYRQTDRPPHPGPGRIHRARSGRPGPGRETRLPARFLPMRASTWEWLWLCW